MFNGNFNGHMELNELKLREIQQEISSRRLAKSTTNKSSWLSVLRSRIKLSNRQIIDESESSTTEKQLSEKILSS